MTSQSLCLGPSWWPIYLHSHKQEQMGFGGKRECNNFNTPTLCHCHRPYKSIQYVHTFKSKNPEETVPLWKLPETVETRLWCKIDLLNSIFCRVYGFHLKPHSILEEVWGLRVPVQLMCVNLKVSMFVEVKKSISHMKLLQELSLSGRQVVSLYFHMYSLGGSCDDISVMKWGIKRRGK